jgi:thymidylate synthase
MPCEKCEEGKYKWGETGECLYETLEDCQLANQDTYLEETLKPQADEPVDVDWTYNFTEEQMEVLHEEGELLVTVEKEEEESMTLLFTYKKEEVEEELEEEKEDDEEEEKEEDELEREYAKLTKSMLDDELDEYIDRITSAIKKLK